MTSCPDLILCVGHILLTEEASLPLNFCFMYNVVISEIASSSVDGIEPGSKKRILVLHFRKQWSLSGNGRNPEDL